MSSISSGKPSLEAGKTVHHQDTGSYSEEDGIFSHNNNGTNKTNDNKDIVVITQEE